MTPNQCHHIRNGVIAVKYYARKLIRRGCLSREDKLLVARIYDQASRIEQCLDMECNGPIRRILTWFKKWFLSSAPCL